MEATETLGQYADWLQIPTQKLRNVNKLRPKQPVLLGQKLNLDYSRVSREAFEQLRRDYHAKLQGEFVQKFAAQASEQTKEFFDLSTRATQHLFEKAQAAASKSFKPTF